MYFDLVQPIRFVVNNLKWLGLWRLDNKWEILYRIYSFILHFVFTFLNIATLWTSVFIADDIEKFTASLFISLTETAFLAKVANILAFNREAVHFFELVEGENMSLKCLEEKQIFESAHSVFYLVGRFYVFASVGVVIPVFTMGALGLTLPFLAWMPFDLQSSYFWYAYVFQLIGMLVTCISNVSIDILQCYFLHHISLIYRVLAYRLASIGYDLNESTIHDFDTIDVDEKIHQQFEEIVKVHQLIKRVTTQCEQFMSYPIFVQILLSTLVLCFSGYQLTIISPLENPGQFIGMVDFLFAMGLQIFLPCYYANEVTLQSGKLCEALYSSNWTGLPKKSRQLIFLYMEFLKEPVYIKSGKFFNIGLPIFSKTIHNAYSCFALLVRLK